MINVEYKLQIALVSKAHVQTIYLLAVDFIYLGTANEPKLKIEAL